MAYYGTTERIALVKNKLYGYTEFDHTDGEIVINTGFINPQMSLILYKTDDITKSVGDGVYTISGHRTAALVGKNRDHFSVAHFVHLEDTFDKIEKYQFD